MLSAELQAKLGDSEAQKVAGEFFFHVKNPENKLVLEVA
jgi:hypothetical protein